MTTPAILGQLTLGYSPMIARDRSVIATRITVFPERRDAAPDAQALVDALLAVWPAPGDEGVSLNLRELPGAAARSAASVPGGPVAPNKTTPLSLNIASEPWLHAMLVVQPPPIACALVPELVEEATAAALFAASSKGIRGAAVTPFLLAEVQRRTSGASVRANLALLESNAALAAHIAVALEQSRNTDVPLQRS